MRMKFKTKILLLVMVPLILVSMALTALSIYQAKKLGSNNVASFTEMIYNLRRNELKNYTELALTSVKHIYNSADEIDPKKQEEAKKILRNLSFGKDGYFFVYDYEGINVAHPKKPQLEGKNLWDLKDKNGVYLIRSLVNNAKKTIGGYTEYVWDKPSKKRGVDKIGFSMGLENWEWMIGTGLYNDDLEDAVGKVEGEVSDNITHTLLLISGLALGFTLLVGLVGARYTMSEGKLADDKLKQLSRRVVQGQEEERARVSLKLQKDINQELTVALSQLKKVANGESLQDPETFKHFSLAVKIIQKTKSDVYRISGELRPEMLDKEGLYAAAEKLSSDIAEKSTIDISFKKIDMIETRLTPEIEIAVYRIIQASLTNMAKHSHANKASVRIRRTADMLSVNIQDDGVGFNSSEVQKGLDIIDMRVRAEALGGTFHLFSSTNTMTTIRVDIPLTA
ncbi:MAG: two-component system NarL family sensor kinase [Candidatus Endobugula sp.]|jgi:two-component system NarL family sensor kinase